MPTVYLLAIIGAMFPVWYHFKGGKALATTLGLALFLNPLITIAIVVFFAVLLAITKIMSLSTILGTITWAVLSLCFEAPLTAPVIILYCACVALIVYSHRKNIVRLLTGKENKFTLKKKQTVPPTTNLAPQNNAAKINQLEQ